MRWDNFEASHSKNFDIDEFGEHLKDEYEPYNSRDLLGKKKIDFEQKLVDAAKKYNNLN
jgi:hypothetical protein